VNFGDCRGEIGLRRPILLYSLEEVKSLKAEELFPLTNFVGAEK
jgi:hypothetical protein